MNLNNQISYRIYDKKLLLKYIFLFVLMSISAMVTSSMSLIAFLPIATILLVKNKIGSLFFCVLAMMAYMVGNSYFFPKGAIGFAALRGTLMILAVFMSARVAGKRNSNIVTPFLGLIPYLFFMTISSAIGWSPIVSYLKLLMFTLIYMTLYAIANETITLNSRNETKIRAAIISIACVFLLGSLLIKPFPGISQMNLQRVSLSELSNYVSLFQGMTNHSQCLGPTVAVMSVFVLGDLLFTSKRFYPLYVVLLMVSPIIVFWTSSRTAMGTYLIGNVTVIYFFIKEKRILNAWKAKVFSVIMPLLILLLLVVMCLPSFQDEIKRFVLKTTDASSEVIEFERVINSRQGLINNALYNFSKKPLIGNGFQVSEDMAYEKRQGLLSYLSAPVEKGVWVYAVLEEGGVIGFTLFVTFLLTAFIKLVQRRAYIAASMLLVVAVSNMGEFTIFSMSYTGGILWSMTFAAAVMDALRIKRQKALLPAKYYYKSSFNSYRF